MRYRKEIDGLRAVCVLSVVLCHAGVGLLQGGFLGVDIFFLISGYLITGIVLEDLDQGRFSLKRFYERRARRILPALFLVMGLCLPLAYRWMLPDDLENFGQSLFATVAFGNNVLLYLTSGYWSQQAELKPLAHTWSLGVEEQYYLLAPFLLWGLWKLGRKNRMGLLFLLCLLSLGWSQLAATHWPDFNFLMIFSRAWQLLLGGILAIGLTSHARLPDDLRCQNALSIGGSLLIVISFVSFSRSTVHPGFVTLVPMVGAALVISFADGRTLVGKFLANRFWVFTGLISYSLYLWHQPLLVFKRLTSLEQPAWYDMLPWVLLSYLLAGLSWKFIEQPFRNPHTIPLRIFWPVIIGSGLGLALLGLYWHSTSGLIHNWPELEYDSDNSSKLNAAYNESALNYQTGTFPSGGEKGNILIVGDSFARDFINAGTENGYFRRHNMTYHEFPDPCRPGGPDTTLLQHSSIVILAFNFTAASLTCVSEVFVALRTQTEAGVIVLGVKNFGWNNNAVMLLPTSSRTAYRAKIVDEVVAANNAAKAIFSSSVYVDILATIADDAGKVPVFTPDGKFISQDTLHLTRYGAKYLGEILFEHPMLRQMK